MKLPTTIWHLIFFVALCVTSFQVITVYASSHTTNIHQKIVQNKRNNQVSVLNAVVSVVTNDVVTAVSTTQEGTITWTLQIPHKQVHAGLASSQKIRFLEQVEQNRHQSVQTQHISNIFDHVVVGDTISFSGFKLNTDSASTTIQVYALGIHSLPQKLSSP